MHADYLDRHGVMRYLAISEGSLAPRIWISTHVRHPGVFGRDLVEQDPGDGGEVSRRGGELRQHRLPSRDQRVDNCHGCTPPVSCPFSLSPSLRAQPLHSLVCALPWRKGGVRLYRGERFGPNSEDTIMPPTKLV